MKKTIVLLIGINITIGAIVFGLFYLSETYPFNPGEPLYPIQDTAETMRLYLTPLGEKQSIMAFIIAERRLADLDQADNPKEIDAAVEAFDTALERAVQYSKKSNTSPLHLSQTIHHLKTLLANAQLVLNGIEINHSCELVIALQTKVDNLLTPEKPDLPETIVIDTDVSPAFIDAKIVLFLNEEIDHDEFPLFGKHQDTECNHCHKTGKYVSTPTECHHCHTEISSRLQDSSIYLMSQAAAIQMVSFTPANIYLSHFEGSCDECHNEEGWIPIDFDHRGVFECHSCHYKDILDPAIDTFEIHKAYPSKCIICHQDIESWEETMFNHLGIDECLSCHIDAEPKDHYTNLPCQGCHTDVEDWNIYVFEHQGCSDCKECHQGSTNHYAGTCNTCHRNTSSWLAYDFIHIALHDCQTCHIPDQDHFSGQCSNCHNKSAWKPATFRHVNFSVFQCATCHEDDIPKGHYTNTCGQCHDTISWSQLLLDHSGNTACINCHTSDTPPNHYGDICSKCHITSNWLRYSFDHTGFTNCFSCHANDAPNPHYGSNCSNCHTTTNWLNISFDHNGYTICSDCHNASKGHWPGECNSCHISTTDWTDIRFNHDGYSDCKSCHASERPGPPHPSKGQCSKCHTTESWTAPTPTPVNEYTATPSKTPKDTFTPTPSPTWISTNTSTPPPTNTSTSTPEPTETGTTTPVPTNTPSPTITNTLALKSP